MITQKSNFCPNCGVRVCWNENSITPYTMQPEKITLEDIKSIFGNFVYKDDPKTTIAHWVTIPVYAEGDDYMSILARFLLNAEEKGLLDCFYSIPKKHD